MLITKPGSVSWLPEILGPEKCNQRAGEVEFSASNSRTGVAISDLSIGR